ncbi:MAG: OmpA family protein [Rickettsiales bacterium]|jgi:outer membrane protein OmpA-like peptidoglycan-associated protein|nr:OmpA family protein [Rickettsiales bacterium]
MKKLFALLGIITLTACAGTSGDENYATPTVDYVEALDTTQVVAPDSFLNQLAINYRSYAIFNARRSGYPDIGEIFAHKAVVAFSGETPMPEAMDNWNIGDRALSMELSTACNDLIDVLKRDMSEYCPIEAAEAQAKYDCWLSAVSSGQMGTANECRSRFMSVMGVLRAGNHNGCGTQFTKNLPQKIVAPEPTTEIVYYPEPSNVTAGQMRAREGVVIVNNVNLPAHLINPEPVKPMVFNQNIYGGDKTLNGGDRNINKEMHLVSAQLAGQHEHKAEPDNNDDMVSREEFTKMMLLMRAEVAAINAKLDNMQNQGASRAVLKVQQIPLEPKEKIVEEVFEVYFDFDKAIIKPEYEKIIRELANAANTNRNLKVSVVGHTDTMGSKKYNYALGGKRAKIVRDMLIKYGIPSGQIVAVSAGENDLKIKTGDGVANAENRRARVTKEETITEEPAQKSITAVVAGQGIEMVEADK